MTSRCALLLVFSLLVTEQTASAADDDVAAARVRLVAAAERGRADEPLVAAWCDYAEARARKAAASEGVELPPDFWTWLAKSRVSRTELLLGLGNDGATKPLANLQRLRASQAEAVERLPRLAIAFAFAWSDGPSHAPPRRFWDEADAWQRDRRDVPDMETSFRWYAERQKDLELAPFDAPWQLLLRVAVNETPIEERRWVLERYGSHAAARLQGLPGEVPYESIDGIHVHGEVRTLPNYLKLGGICGDQAWYAVGVLRSLGIPAEWVEGGGHAWPVWWLRGRGRSLEYHQSNELGNDPGAVRDPRGHSMMWLEDERVFVAGCNVSFETWQQSLCAAYVERLLEEPLRTAFRPAVVAALERNPWCRTAWLDVAAACRDGRIPPEEGRKLFERLLRLTSALPSIQIQAFETALPPEKREGAVGVAGYFDLIEKAARSAGRERPDLAREFQLVQAAAYDRTGDARASRDLYMRLVTLFGGVDMPRFQVALRNAMRHLDGEANRAERERFIDEASKGLRYLTKEQRESGHPSPYFLQFRRLVYEDRVARGDQRGADAVRLAILLETRRPQERQEAKGRPGFAWTATLGSAEGAASTDTSRDGPLVGCRYTKAPYSAGSMIASFQPLYRTASGVRAGAIFGEPRGALVEVLAPEGFAVGVLAMQGGDRIDRVTGFQFVFMRVKDDGRLDASDCRFGDWQATFKEGDALSVGGDGRPFVGVRAFVADDLLRGIALETPAK